MNESDGGYPPLTPDQANGLRAQLGTLAQQFGAVLEELKVASNTKPVQIAGAATYGAKAFELALQALPDAED